MHAVRVFADLVPGSLLDLEPGIEVRMFNPVALRSPRLLGMVIDFGRINKRMHNKSFTVDGQVSIVGGRNIGDEYFDASGEDMLNRYLKLDMTTYLPEDILFKVDITSRITKYVKVTKEGFSLENAQIPTGKHRLTMQVQDEKQRVAERELRLEVE